MLESYIAGCHRNILVVSFRRGSLYWRSERYPDGLKKEDWQAEYLMSVNTRILIQGTVINMAGIDVISEDIHSFVAGGLMYFWRQHCVVTLAGLTKGSKETFSLTRLDKLFVQHADVESAKIFLEQKPSPISQNDARLLSLPAVRI